VLPFLRGPQAFSVPQLVPGAWNLESEIWNLAHGSAACRAESLWLSGATRDLLSLRSAGRLSLPAERTGLAKAQALTPSVTWRTAKPLWDLKLRVVRAGEMFGEYGILAASILAEVNHHGLFSKSLGHQGIV
jgi:hypothetical protein